jgi:hypothetical protein
MCSVKNKSDTSNIRGNWSHVRIFHKISEQRNWKERDQEDTENSHIVHCAPTTEIINVKLQNVYHGK